MLREGEFVPDVELQLDDGRQLRLDDLLRQGPVIVFFYPADFTPICTREVCGLRDVHPAVVSAGYQVIGVSPQSTESHARFRRQYSLPYPLACDEDRKLIGAFGVSGPLGFGVRRATFVIAEDGLITRRVVADLTVGTHLGMIAEAIAGN